MSEPLPGYDAWKLTSPPEGPSMICTTCNTEEDLCQCEQPTLETADPFDDGGDEKYDRQKNDALDD